MPGHTNSAAQFWADACTLPMPLSINASSASVAAERIANFTHTSAAVAMHVEATAIAWNAAFWLHMNCRAMSDQMLPGFVLVAAPPDALWVSSQPAGLQLLLKSHELCTHTTLVSTGIAQTLHSALILFLELMGGKNGCHLRELLPGELGALSTMQGQCMQAEALHSCEVQIMDTVWCTQGELLMQITDIAWWYNGHRLVHTMCIVWCI